MLRMVLIPFSIHCLHNVCEADSFPGLHVGHIWSELEHRFPAVHRHIIHGSHRDGFVISTSHHPPGRPGWRRGHRSWIPQALLKTFLLHYPPVDLLHVWASTVQINPKTALHIWNVGGEWIKMNSKIVLDFIFPSMLFIHCWDTLLNIMGVTSGMRDCFYTMFFPGSHCRWEMV